MIDVEHAVILDVEATEIDWSLPERQTRAAAEFLGGLEDQDPDADRKLPKAISPTDPCSAWTAKAGPGCRNLVISACWRSPEYAG